MKGYVVHVEHVVVLIHNTVSFKLIGFIVK